MRGAASASAHTSSAASSTWSTIPHSRTPPLQSNIEKVGDIVRPSSATALLSSLSTSSSGIGESLRSPSAEISMTSEASTSCASTPTTANTLPPLIEESSVEDETADGVGIATEKLVKSLIVVPSPSDTARVTSAISNDTVASGKTNEEDRKSIDTSVDLIQEREEQEDTGDNQISQQSSSKDHECPEREDLSIHEEPTNSPTNDGVLPSTSSGIPASPADMTASSRNPLRKVRYSLRLPAKAAQRLKRIANFQPGSLRRIGLSALKISDMDCLRLADGSPPQIPVALEDHINIPSTSQENPRDIRSLSHQLPMIPPQQPPPPQVPSHMLPSSTGQPGHPSHHMGPLSQQLLPSGPNQGHHSFQVMVKQEPPSQFTPQPHPMQQTPQQQVLPQYPPGMQPHQMHQMRQMTAEEYAQMRAREGFMAAQIKQEVPSGSGQPTPVPGTPQPQQITPQPGSLGPMGSLGPPTAPPGSQPMNPQQQRIQQQQQAAPSASNSPLLVNLLSNQQPPQQQYMYPGPSAQGLSMQQIAAIQQQQQHQQYQQRILQQQQQQAMMQQQQQQVQQQQQAPPPTTPNPGHPQGFFPTNQAGPPGTPGRPIPPYAMGQPPMYHQAGPQGQMIQRMNSYPGNAQQFRPPPQQSQQPIPPQQQQQPPAPPQQLQQPPVQDTSAVAEPPKKKKRPTKKQKEAAAAAALEQQQQQQQQQMQAYYGQQQQQQERMQMMQQQQQQGQMVQQPGYPGQGYPGMPPPQGAFPPGYLPGGAQPTQQQIWQQQQQLQQQRMAMFQQQQAQGQQPGGPQQPMGQWPQQRQLPVPYPPGNNSTPDAVNQQQNPIPGATMQHRLSGEFAPPPVSSGKVHPQQQQQGSFHRSDSSASVYSGSHTPFGQQGPSQSEPTAVPPGPQQNNPGGSGDIGEKAIVDQLLNSSEPLADLGDLGDLGDLDIEPMDVQDGQTPSTSNGERNERSDRLAASIELVVDEVASGRAGAFNAELAAIGERRGSVPIPLPAASPGGRNLSHEHNMRAHAFHGANRMIEPNGIPSNAMRLVNGHEAKTNGARRQQQQPPSSQQQPQSQQGGMMQQQQQQQIIKGEDETNDAKIIEFAKTISEKDKKIKAAAESKTKLQAKATRKPRTTKKAAPATIGMPQPPPPSQIQQQNMPMQHQQMQQHPNAQMMMQQQHQHPGAGGHLQLHPQMHMQMLPQHHQQQQHHEEMMMMHHQQQQQLQQQQQMHQMPLHHLPQQPPPPSQNPQNPLPQPPQVMPTTPTSAAPPQPQSQN